MSPPDPHSSTRPDVPLDAELRDALARPAGPDTGPEAAERAWRELRAKLPERRRPGRPGPAGWLAWGLPAAAAAALAFVVAVQRPEEVDTPASVEYVDVPGSDAPTVVFLDDESGWLVVWSVQDKVAVGDS